MTEADIRIFTQALSEMAELCEHELSERMIAIYFEDLLEYGVNEVLNALRAHRRDPDRGRFFPKPADIVQKLEGDLKAQALRAWDAAVAAALEIGAYRSVRFQDVATMKAIDAMGGWPSWLDWPDRETPFKQREFCERWIAYRNAGQAGDRDFYLPGLNEIENRRNGFSVESRPALVGSDTLASLARGIRGPKELSS